MEYIMDFNPIIAEEVNNDEMALIEGKIKQGKSLSEEEVINFLDTIIYITRKKINSKMDDFSWKCDLAQSILCHYLNKIGCPNFPCMTQSAITNDIEGHSFVTIMLMVNDRRLNADSFWFTLFHEIGHIINGDYGISFVKETAEQEVAADKFAEDCLIPHEENKSFISNKKFILIDIKGFANQIERDPGIVLGRLQNDGFVGFDDWTMKPLRHKYKVKMNL